MKSSTLINKYKKMPLPLKASMWFVFSSFIQKGISFLTTPIFTRVMTTENYGVTAIYTSWLGIITIFATLELATGVFNKAMIKYEDDRDGYMSTSLSLSTIATVICFIVFLGLRNYWNIIFGIPDIYIFVLFGEILVSMPLSLWSIRNRFEYKYRSVVGLSLMTTVLGPILSIILMWFVDIEHQPLAKVGGIVIVKLIMSIYLYVKIYRIGKKIIEIDYWKYALMYNIPLIPHYLSQQVLSQSDRIMINNICGESEVGMYSVAYQLANVTFIFTLAMHKSFTPWSFQTIKEGNFEKLKEYSILIEVVIGILCLVCSLLAPECIYILGGEQYMDAIWIVPPVAMSVLFQTIYTFFANIEFYYEKTKMVMIASIIVSLVNIVLNYFFIPKYGFVAAGYTTLVCYIIYSMIHYIFMKKVCNVQNINPYRGKIMWIIGIIFTIMSVCSSYLYNFNYIRYLLFGLGVFVALYLGVKITKRK